MSNSGGFCKVPWIVGGRFLASFRSPKCCPKRGQIGPTSPLNGIAFQSLPSIAIKIAYWRHWESILASLGSQKLWFCKGHVHKISIFTFCVLNPFQNQYLSDFGRRMAPERVQKRLPRTAKSIQESVIFLNHFWYVFRTRVERTRWSITTALRAYIRHNVLVDYARAGRSHSHTSRCSITTA